MIKKLTLVIILLSQLAFSETPLTRSETERLIQKLQESLKEEKKEEAKSSSDSFFYLGYGVGVGGGTFSLESTPSGGATTLSETETEVVTGTLKFGYAQENNNRWELSITGVEVTLDDTNSTIQNLSGLDIDWYAVYDLDTTTTQLYWSLGFGSYVWEESNLWVVGDENVKGVSFNLGVGAFFEMGEKMELELAYRIKGIGWQEIISGTTQELYAHGYSQLFVGLNYRFNDN